MILDKVLWVGRRLYLRLLELGNIVTAIKVQQGDDIRVNIDAAIVSTLSDLFKLELKFKLLFDNVPVPDKGKYDSLLTANLVFAWEQETEEEEAAQ